VAGVGFSLKKLALDRSIGGALRYYGTAGMISSGPWLISICTLLFWVCSERRWCRTPR
jgi:uncharacterized membrane protein